VRLRPPLFTLAWGLAVAGCDRDISSGPSPSVRVVEAGWSFGFCLGTCRGRLDLSGAELSYQVLSRTGDQVYAHNRGRLTTEGAARLDSLASGLPEVLLPLYGCPDCADGGVAFVTLVRGSGSMRVEYEYGRPPQELSALDDFLRGVMDALSQCRATREVIPEANCTPPPS